jgi:hypothetical protein
MLCKIPEEQKSHLHHGGSLKSRAVSSVSSVGELHVTTFYSDVSE